MVDTVSPGRRSEIMSTVRRKDTGPELKVRRIVYQLGFRYRLHCKDLPGTPDLVFRKRHKVIFVNGCFWHAHQGCPLARVPKSHREFWEQKFKRNTERDIENTNKLKNMGFKVLTIWECQLKDLDELAQTIKVFLAA